MTLVCPLCSETLEEEGAHFYKHFKYKRYACGQNSCDSEFYTEAERNAHCTKHGHKRSFQKTVNPYIDKMISMVTADARELSTKDMEIVLEKRFGNGNSRGISECSSHQIPPENNRILTSPAIGTTPSGSTSSEMTSTKKKRSLIAGGSTSTSSSNSTTSTSASVTPSASKKSKTTNSVQRRNQEETPRRSQEVDSTTADQTVTSSEKSKKSRKKRTDSEQQQISTSTPSGTHQSYDQMSAIDKLIGWFDPNVPERQTAAKVSCAVCNQEIIYDFILRKGHVTEKHMAADTHPDDYEELLKTAMDLSFPDLPNSNLACQLCMTGTDIRKCSRREHIEKLHTTSLPPLQCPDDECKRAFRRQCELSMHMKESHKLDMSRYRNSVFQQARRRRNFMISEMINKCFPWSKLEKIEQITTTSSEIAPDSGTSSDRHRTDSFTSDIGFNRDVRVLDVNKTRRAPQYNHNDSESSDSDSDDPNNSSGHQTVDDLKSSAEDFSEDVIFIGRTFNAEIAAKLASRSCILVKTEVREESAEPVETQRKEGGVEDMDVVKDEEDSQGLSPPALVVPVLHSIYEPIDPNPHILFPPQMTSTTPSSPLPPPSYSEDPPSVEQTNYSHRNKRGFPDYRNQRILSPRRPRDTGRTPRNNRSNGHRNDYPSQPQQRRGYRNSNKPRPLMDHDYSNWHSNNEQGRYGRNSRWN